MSFNRLSLIATTAVLAGVACSHAQVRPAPVSQMTITSPQPAPAAKTATQDQQAPATTDADAQGRADLERALAELRNLSVFFAFDSSTLTSEGEARLAEVGRILAQHPKLGIRIEGNCDERGTEDYNLSLGQNRADEARRYIMTMGATADQVKTVSYGDERPKAKGHSEDAWQQNRRDDIVVAD